MATVTATNTLIIGGGIVGATLALKLAQQQQQVTLIDARPKLSEAQWQDKLAQRDARVFALSIASIELLKQVGAWQLISQSGRKADYTQMQVWQQDGKGELKFGDEELPQLLGSMVEPFVIEHALYQRMQHESVAPYLTVISGHKVTELDWFGAQQGYQVRLDSGDTYRAKLLIGADGRGSMVRQQASIQLDTLDYKQIAICCAINTEQPHQATARQLMLPTGTLALLPLADITDDDKAHPQHWQSVVWSLPSNRALELLDLVKEGDVETLRYELAAASQYALGDIKQIESIASFPLTAQQAKHYVKDNLVLIGDAAHGVHPLAGQGLNLGMLDVSALVEVLMTDYQRSGGRSWGELATLRQYERNRRPHNSVMMHSFSIMNGLFAGDFAALRPVQQIRSEGMYRVGKIKPLMRFFTQKASGL
ncbi:FAD-dependent oxidoreductase [Psychrobacter sp. FDAARGOS_221]|uniref:FAD-dependent oxidoreductase n=1 Tax=Psychrobacter sp. FDAARGOS_221 TaxID=1975705 RepID=UPI000BB570F2|nr:FAD-dependent oxidoreductase [Psychrobacter sp. FDAARGOS_221]PNK61203.1 FAD-dependent oxidoreductase [Psychrobacter sp. FDAARGOS_221]